MQQRLTQPLINFSLDREAVSASGANDKDLFLKKRNRELDHVRACSCLLPSLLHRDSPGGAKNIIVLGLSIV